MGHDVPTFIGVDKTDIAKKIQKVQPDYMPMGSRGMADMGEMEMPLPDNTIKMMDGWGQFGPIEMGSMFSVVKVRQGLSANDYADPGWYQHPQGTVAWEWTGEVPNPVKSGDAKTMTPAAHGGHGKQG
jgi:manganese oxidase